LRKHGAYLRPVGDARQLGSPEAGGGFRLIEDKHGSHQLMEVVRFHQEWERENSLLLRAGDVAADRAYTGHGRVMEGTQDQMQQAAVDRWVADHLAGRETILTT